MIWFIVRRLLTGALLLLGISAVIFAVVQLLPGDAASRLLGPNATPAQVAQVRHELGLDHSPVRRYLDWLGGALHGDFGHSLVSGQSFGGLMAERAANTVVLVLAVLAVTVVASLAVGTAAALRPEGRLNAAVSTVSSLLIAVPEFAWASLLVIVFALRLHWLPAVSLVPGGAGVLTRPQVLVLPVLSLSVVLSAAASRLIRAVVLDVSVLPHVEAARLQGVPERRMILRHLLPGARGGVAQVVALMVAPLLSGTVVVEQVFSYPGVSSVLLNAVAQRDTPVVEAIALFIAGGTVLALLAADLVTALGDPRARMGEA